MNEPSVIDSVMRTTVAWVRDEDSSARMKPVPVSHFVNGLSVMSKAVDLLIEQRREAMLILAASGVRPERILAAYEPGEDDDAVSELYPVDRDQFLLACEDLDAKAKALFDAEREVGESSWYNTGDAKRRDYKMRVIFGEVAE